MAAENSILSHTELTPLRAGDKHLDVGRDPRFGVSQAGKRLYQAAENSTCGQRAMAAENSTC
jgi:hypothetical protein